MQPLPYDNGKSLVRGLDTLVTLFDASDTGLISSRIDANPLKEQREYLEEVHARVMHARDLTKNFLDSFDTTNPKQVHEKFRLIRAEYGETPRVKEIVDMGYCVGFIEARKKIKDYLGQVHVSTYARKFVLPKEANSAINDILAQRIFDTPKAKARYMRRLIKEQQMPLDFIICDKKVHEMNTPVTHEEVFLSVLTGQNPWDKYFQCTVQHEVRHIQDVLLGTYQLAHPGLPQFHETSAHLYANSSFRGLNRTRKEFLEKLSERRECIENSIKYHELMKTFENNNFTPGITCNENRNDIPLKVETSTKQREFYDQIVTKSKDIDLHEKEGMDMISKISQLIQAIPTENWRAIWPHARALSYVFSTANQREVVDRFALALQVYNNS